MSLQRSMYLCGTGKMSGEWLELELEQRAEPRTGQQQHREMTVRISLKRA
jgi:hypothetical protein